MPFYLGLFFIALATLALEISLARIFSVVSWYHMSFLAISIAMLGMTAGAIHVQLHQHDFEDEKLIVELTKYCKKFAVYSVLSISLICWLPLGISLEENIALMMFIALGVVILSTLMPFYYSGIVVTAVLTKVRLPIGKLYAADLLGAASGCLVILLIMYIIDTPSAILMCGLLGYLASLFFRRELKSKCSNLFGVLLILSLSLGIYWLGSNHWLKPVWVKNSIAGVYSAIEFEEWNSHSRVAISPVKSGKPQLWAAHPSFYKSFKNIDQRYMNIDGAAGTTMRAYESKEDIEHLQYDVTNIAYHVNPTGGAAIIGVGGGKDILSALWFGHEKVTAIELNAIFVDLLNNELLNFANIGNDPRVDLRVDEARSWMSRNPQKYALIQMALIDTWAATGAGAFSLSENGLYTIEAWNLFLSRLNDDGMFTVSRWFSPDNLGETGRLISLAVASLIESGAENPSQHIALVTQGKVATLVVSKLPFSADASDRLRSASIAMKHHIELMPNKESGYEILNKMRAAKTIRELEIISDQSQLNFTPPTDNSPYFFNMLKLRNLGAAVDGGEGVVGGNLQATITLICLIVVLSVFTVLAIVYPLYKSTNSGKAHGASILYFALIGTGFMTVEIGLMQRLSVFLGHPVYGLGVLLFSIIAATGIGSLVSEKLKHSDEKIRLLSIACVLAVLIMNVTSSAVMTIFLESSLIVKIFVSIIILFPLGIILGCFFPIGLRLADGAGDVNLPWYWGINGIFGVLFSSLSVFIAIYFSIATNFYVSAFAYGLTFFCIVSMQRRLLLAKNGI